MNSNHGAKPMTPEVLAAKGAAMLRSFQRPGEAKILPIDCLCFEDILGEVFVVKRKDCPVHRDDA